METFKINTIEEALEDFKEGRFVIVVDDEDRENEGDLIIAAEKITPEKVNFMLKYARGVLCAPLTLSRNDIGECLVIIPRTPFALKCHLSWEEGEANAANISSMECVTIKENDTVLIKSPSGEITRGAMYVYEREKKENDIVYLQEGHRLSSDLRIYYKKARLNADGQTYSYIDALALLDYPTCSSCGKN